MEAHCSSDMVAERQYDGKADTDAGDVVLLAKEHTEYCMVQWPGDEQMDQITSVVSWLIRPSASNAN